MSGTGLNADYLTLEHVLTHYHYALSATIYTFLYTKSGPLFSPSLNRLKTALWPGKGGHNFMIWGLVQSHLCMPISPQVPLT